MRKVGGIDVDGGPVGGGEVSERGVFENFSIVKVESQHAPRIKRSHEPNQVPGEESLIEEVSLNVSVQELIVEVLKNAIAEESVVGGRERTSRNATNGIHFVKQSLRLAIYLDDGFAEFFEDSIGESRRARSAP